MKKLHAFLVIMTLMLTLLPTASFAEAPDVLVFTQVDDGFSAKMGGDVYNQVHDYIVEKINVDIQPAYFPSDQYMNRVNMMLAGGEQVDIISRISKAQAIEWLNDGLIQDITDLVSEKVPNYAAVCEAYPLAALAHKDASHDGSQIGFPYVSTIARANSFQIRTDWLMKLGMEMPTTIDEFDAYLEAVKTQDPDGNGVDDTYGICGAIWGGNVVNMLAYYYLPAGMDWYLDENGDVQHPATHPNYKALLSKVIEWQNNGYMPPEALLSADDQRLDWFVNNQIGAVAGWYSAPIGGRKALVEKIPEAEYMPFNMTGLEDAANAITNDASYAHLNVITHNANLDAVARFYNFLYTEEGQKVLIYGLEGISYNELSEGDYKYPKSIADENGKANYYGHFNPQMDIPLKPWGYWPGIEYDVTLYRSLTNVLNALPGFDAPQKFVAYDWSGTESEYLIADLDTYLSEQQALVLAGELPVDAWDNIVDTWRTMGGNTHTAERNTQYHAQVD